MQADHSLLAHTHFRDIRYQSNKWQKERKQGNPGYRTQVGEVPPCQSATLWKDFPVVLADWTPLVQKNGLWTGGSLQLQWVKGKRENNLLTTFLYGQIAWEDGGWIQMEGGKCWSWESEAYEHILHFLVSNINFITSSLAFLQPLLLRGLPVAAHDFTDARPVA